LCCALFLTSARICLRLEIFLRLRLVVPPFHLSLASFIVVRFQDKPPCHVTSLPNSRLYPVESTSLHEWQHGSATTNNNSKQQQQNDDDDNNNNRMQNNTLRCVDCRHCSLKTTRRDRCLGERASGNRIHERAAAEASDDESARGSTPSMRADGLR
jgi:hypothetical protein